MWLHHISDGRAGVKVRREKGSEDGQKEVKEVEEVKEVKEKDRPACHGASEETVLNLPYFLYLPNLSMRLLLRVCYS